jgi:hypothetical protein
LSNNLESKIFVAGLGLRGTRKDDSYLCFLEFFPSQERWFLSKVVDLQSDDQLVKVLQEETPGHLMVDIPLNLPTCSTCFLKCPGEQVCPVQEIVTVRENIGELLRLDGDFYQSSPKRYEQERVELELYDHQRPVLARSQTQLALSKSFKKRLRKGIIPYWNRPLDFWVWANYYDALLELFNFSYDSFGPNPPNALFRFHYLRRHFPKNLNLWESSIQILLLEMLRQNWTTKEEIRLLSEVEQGVLSRLNLIKCLEKTLNIFIYDHDLEMLIHRPRAFESFMLAVAGRCAQAKKLRHIDAWANAKEVNFAVPQFGA